MGETSLNELINFFPKQKEALGVLLGDDCKFLLYGGAGYGGKSYFLRWALVLLLVYWWDKYKLTGVQVGLFCEDYPALRDRQLIKIHAEFPGWLGKWREEEKNFYLSDKVGGGIISCRNLDDSSKFASAEFGAIGVDELTKNPKKVFDDLRWRLRWKGLEHPKFLAGSNPGGVGHTWTKRVWLDGQFDPNETEGHLFKFVRARFDDNPYTTQDYRNTLDSLPEKMRRAFRDGDWTVFEGQFFDEWSEQHIIKPFAIPAEWERFIALDYGYSGGYSSVGWYAVDFLGKVYRYREIYTQKRTYSELAYDILQANGNDKIEYAVADPAIWGDRPHHDAMVGESGGESVSDIFYPGPDDDKIWGLRRELGIPDNILISLMKADNSRVTGWGRVREYLRVKKDQHGQESPDFFVLKKACPNFIRTFPSLIFDDTKKDDLMGEEDHCFAGDTKIITKGGLIPIRKLVGKEGFVKSVTGWEKFRNCRLTRKNQKVVKVSFEDGKSVVCTPDHKFFTLDGRMVNGKDLTNEISYVIMSPLEGLLWRLKSLATQFRTLMASGIIYLESIFQRMNDYIVSFGNFIMEKFQRDIMSTIKTLTKQITHLPTWNYCLTLSMHLYTEKELHRPFPKWQEIKRKNGTGVQSEKNGIPNTQKETNSHEQKKNVLSVKESFREQRDRNFVSIPVKVNKEGMKEKIIFRNNVPFAVKYFTRINFGKVRFALQNVGELLADWQERAFPSRRGNKVLSIENYGTQDVYCLTVPSTHLFAVEGGIIVKNCGDEVRYALMSRPEGPVAAIPEKVLTYDERVWKRMKDLQMNKGKMTRELGLGSEG